MLRTRVTRAAIFSDLFAIISDGSENRFITGSRSHAHSIVRFPYTQPSNLRSADPDAHDTTSALSSRVVSLVWHVGRGAIP